MKRIVVETVCVACIMFFTISGCDKQNTASNGEKIENKIFIQFIRNQVINDWEQWEVERDVLINSNTALRQSSDMKWMGGSFYWVVLESKDGKPIATATVEYFKASPVVATASYPLEIEHSGVMQGLTDNFVVKLKETTTHVQLEQLAEQNHCDVEELDRYYWYEEDLIWVSVLKTSKLNALQMSDLFYETGLFESAQANFVILNQPGIQCEEKRIIKVLKDEPVYVRKRCFEHVGRIDTFYFEFVNMDYDFSPFGLFPIGEIPKQFRKEGLSINISGNVINCGVTGGCIEPNIKLSPIFLFEIKSININN